MKTNYVIIAGGRDCKPSRININLCYKLISKLEGDVILYSGNARGADQIPWEMKKEYGCPVVGFTADWDFHDKRAGPIRNRRMLKGDGNPATHLIAFWDGKSRGTKDMIDIAREAGIKVKVFRYKSKENT